MIGTQNLEKKTVSVVVPVYNEFSNISTLVTRVLALNDKTDGYLWSIVFIDDGSTDGSRELLHTIASTTANVKAIFLSRNFGHQIALTAGLDFIDSDFVGVIDGDLQDPPELLPEMIKELESGFDMIYGVRRARNGESLLKKYTASCFYRVLSTLTRVPIPVDTGDFRVFNSKILKAIQRMREYHRFLRGMFAWAGFRAKPFLYERDARSSGVTKYSWRAMSKFALDALLSFSDVPLRVSAYGGMGLAGIGCLGLLYIVYQRFAHENYIAGVSAILFSVLLIGGFQLVILGILGCYIGKIFEEVKRRPLYLVDAIENFSEHERSQVNSILLSTIR